MGESKLMRQALSVGLEGHDCIEETALKRRKCHFFTKCNSASGPLRSVDSVYFYKKMGEKQAGRCVEFPLEKGLEQKRAIPIMNDNG